MTTECTVVFRPTVQSLITSGYEQNRSGACHGSLGRSNRVTFYPKKESLSKKKILRCRAYLFYRLQTIYHHKSSSTPSSWWLCHHFPLYNIFLCRTLCSHPVAVTGRTVLLLCHTVTPISNTPPICLRLSQVTTAEQSVEIPQYYLDPEH